MKLLGSYLNGNTMCSIFSDGTRIRVTNDDEFEFAYACNMDIKLTNKCSANCSYCHEGSSIDGKHGDIMNEKCIETLHPFQEVACGGGDVLSHPDLIPFLQKLKKLNVIANITVNQIHFEQNQELIEKLVNEELIYGLGVSLVAATDKFISLVQKYPNAIVHVINGVVTKEQLEKLSDNNIKMLILGYKHLRRGDEHYAKYSENVKNNQKDLFEALPKLIDRFKVISFDNLAIEQLDVRRLLTEKEWEEFYQGDDGTSTYYIDLVKRQFAKSSTAPFNERYDLLDNVDEMFRKIRG